MKMVLYSEVNLLCIAILLMIYFRDAKLRNNDVQHIMFSRLLFANIVFFATDIVWGIMALEESPVIWANWAVNIVYFSISGITGYFWLSFVERLIDSKRKKTKIRTILHMLPMLLLILLAITSIKTKWLFYIDETGHYQRGVLYILQPILAFILPMYATIKVIGIGRKTRNYEKKMLCRALAEYYIMPCIGGVLQVIYAGTPMLNIGIALSGLWIYFSFQDDIIMLDPLTSMNNRRFFDNSLGDLVRNHDKSSDKRVWLIMMDLDNFKKINDGFGHAEGDKALISVANTLKEIADRHDCIVARIGGDEFAACFESEDTELPKEICDDIDAEMSKTSERYPFKLQLSLGFAELTAEMSAQQLFIAADKLLYEVKNKKEQENL